MFMIQKYDITNLEDIVFNKNIYDDFFKGTLDNNIQNLLIYGPPSSGKKTFVKFILKKLYGNLNTKEIEYTITNYGSNNVKVKLQQSNFHITFKPFNSALDKYIIQEIIVEFCKKKNMYFYDSKTPYKVILLYNADLLSSQAQYALRTLMEQYNDHCRFILIVKNINTVISSIVSRSNKLTLRAPNTKEMNYIFEKIIKGEHIEITESEKKLLVSSSERNVKNMLWRIECYKNAVPYECHWQIIIDNIIDSIVNDTSKSLKKINKIRENIGLLFISNIDACVILEYILKIITQKIKSIKTVSLITDEIAVYERRLKNSTRYILHFEGLVNSIIYIINN